jgi:type I restriction enzyme S subunit
MSEAFSGGSNGTKVSGWPIVSFTEILADQPRNGWSPPAAHHSPSGVPVLTLSSVTHFQFDGSRVKYTSAPTKKDAHYWLREGELLISRSNTAELVGHAAIYDGTPSPGICCDLIMKMRVDGGRASTGFVHYFLQTETARDYLKARAGGASATMQKINKSIVQELPVPVPPLPEQERIVAILDEAFEGIATATAHAERNLHNARELFQSVLQSTFQQKGEDWVETTLEDVLEVQPRNGWSPPAANHSATGTPVLTLSSVTGFQFRVDKIKHTSADTDPGRHYWVRNGDFLITRSNTPKLVGHVAIAEGIEEPTIYPDLIMRMNPHPDRAETRFLYYQLRTPSMREVISGRASGANPTMKKINKGSVQTLPLSMAPLDEQKAIVQKLDALATETRRLEAIYERKLAALAELKQSLLQRAFAGEL